MNTATLPAWPTLTSVPTLSTAPASSQTCTCTRTAALTVERGATLSTKITLTVTDQSVTPPVTSPIDVTGAEFQFTAKTSADVADSDPTTVKIDWYETVTPTQGYTWLKVPAATTQDMLDLSYVMQVRMVSASGVVTPLVSGSLTVTEPLASARFT